MDALILRYVKLLGRASAPDLVRAVMDHGHTEGEVRRGIWRLISGNKVTLGWDRKLAVNP